MELLDQLTPGQVFMLLIGVVLVAAGAVNTVGSAIERIIKLRQAVTSPNEDQNRRLDALEKWRTEVDQKLGRDFAAFRSLEESTAVTQRALLALLGHGLHGNNVAEMTASEQELKTYLTNHH